MEVTPVSSHGSRIFDADGRSYIDFYVGWCTALSVGGSEDREGFDRAFPG